MASGYVTDLMRHDSGQFGLFVSSQNQPRIDVKESAGKRKCVDVVRIDDLDCEGHLRIGIAHQVLAQAVDVLGNYRIVDHLGLSFHLLGNLLAHGNLLF